jgi:hypothetical protein
VLHVHKKMTMLLTLAVLAGAALVGGGPGAASADALTREFEGRILSVNRSAKTFLLRDARRKRSVRIRTTRSTRYEDLRGFRSLRVGMRVEVKARYSGGRWLARHIEREDGDDD